MEVWISTLLAVGVLVAAALHGSDATWDTRNYHIYNGFALLNKARGTDIAPAHMQTWFPPTQDLVYYLLAKHIQFTPMLNLLLALPHAIAVVLAFVFTCRLMRARTGEEAVLAGLAVLIGATGAAGGSTIATAMSEMLPACLFLAGMIVLIPRDLESAPGGGKLFLAGLLAGAACGFKLTLSYAAISLGTLSLFIPPINPRGAMGRMLLLAVGGGVGALAISGYWWVLQFQRYGNPLFPVYNDIFRSPLVAPVRYIDASFLPHSLMEALEAPWAWALHLYRGVSESRVRDPRFALGVVAALVVLAQWVAGRCRQWPIPFLAGWFLLSFALWRFQFSVFRYLSISELLTGSVLLLASLPLLRSLAAVRVAIPAFAILLLVLLRITVYPYVQRAASGGPLWDVDLGPIGKRATVLLLDNGPTAYLAAFAPPSVRFIATNDSFMTLDRSNPMQADAEAAITDRAGELWGVESWVDQGHRADETLARYGLAREACRGVKSNLSPEPLRLCKLVPVNSDFEAAVPDFSRFEHRAAQDATK